MSWMIENAVVRGEIDNTTPGRTLGRLWLIHQPEPIVLDLQGDCWRDLAGSILTFRNPQPDFSLEAPELSHPQSGLVGDMTASLKRKVFHETDWDGPCSWQNTLSLEWFDKVNGRVVIETPLFELTISESSWRQSAAEESLQKQSNMDAMRAYVATILQREVSNDLWAGDNVDEFAWEKRFQESDRMSEVYQEIFEKYFDDPESHQKQAYAMGMDHLAAQSRHDEDDSLEEDDDEFSETDELLHTPYDEWEDDDSFAEFLDGAAGDFINHPLQEKAQNLAIEALEMMGENTDEAAMSLCSHLLQVATKLAGALNVESGEYEQEAGYILASLKRCLYWQNEALSACQELMTKSDSREEVEALQKIRSTIFEIREQLTEMRREFKQN
jgi:hypothetical protein